MSPLTVLPILDGIQGMESFTDGSSMLAQALMNLVTIVMCWNHCTVMLGKTHVQTNTYSGMIKIKFSHKE